MGSVSCVRGGRGCVEGVERAAACRGVCCVACICRLGEDQGGCQVSLEPRVIRNGILIKSIALLSICITSHTSPHFLPAMNYQHLSNGTRRSFHYSKDSTLGTPSGRVGNYGTGNGRRRCVCLAELEVLRSIGELSALFRGARLTYHRDAYLLANTYISSRAFPSTLLDPSSSRINPSHHLSEGKAQPEEVPANEVTPTSYPVLIPGLDTLNHRRNQAVTWVSVASPESDTDTKRTVGLVLRADVPANEQVFNNYGPTGTVRLSKCKPS